MARRTFGNRWEVIAPLDEGGQGWVYEVKDLTGTYAGRAVLKRLKNLDRLDRFEREIAAIRDLDHPGIPDILDFSLHDPAYYVAPLYPGRSIDQSAPLEPLPALALFIAICEVVEFAHSRGVVHRDIKPENIVLRPDGTPVLLDFGLCYLEDDSRLTATTEQVGSRYYVAPELEGGRLSAVTKVVDTYSLGKLLYFLLTNQVLRRESFLDNDIVDILGDPQLQYINERIFRISIVDDPSKRAQVSVLRSRATTIRRLLREHRYPGREGSVCRFCGEGKYIRLHPKTLRVREPGIETNRTYEAIYCEVCGNMQWFIPKE